MYLALLIGLLLGWFLARRHVDQQLTVLYHFRFRSEHKYLGLYDICDGDFSYQMMLGDKNPPKNYAEFLLWHQSSRPRAGKVFREFWIALLKELARDYMFLLAVPAVFFWSYWYYFLLAAVLPHIYYVLHRKLVKRNGVDFYTILIHTAVVSDIRRRSS